MVARKAAPVARKATARKAAPATARRTRRAPAEEVEEAPRTRRAPARKAAPVEPQKRERDVTQYADKEPTAYHKAYATWLVREVGVSLKGLTARDAFLMGVSTATAARNSFMDSDFLAEWREKNGVAKRGPKGDSRTAQREVVSDDEFEDDTEESDEGFDEPEADEDDDDFEDSSDDDDDFEDEPEPAPKVRKSAPRKAAAAPARGSRRAAPVEDADDDDEMLF